MKNRSYFYWIVALSVILLWCSGCDRQISKIIEAEPNEATGKSLIIKHLTSEEISIQRTETIKIPDDENIFARMSIVREQRAHHFTNSIGRSTSVRYFISQIDVCKILDPIPNPMTTVDLRNVAIGRVPYDRIQVNCPTCDHRTVMSFNGYRVIPDWEFSVTKLERGFEAPDSEIDSLYAGGQKPLTITNSPDILDLNVILDYPGLNSVVNIAPGQQLDPHEDLTIVTRYPLMGIMTSSSTPNTLEFVDIWAIVFTRTETGYHMENKGAINITPTIPSSEITLPAKEILKLLEDFPNANMFMISIHKNQVLDLVQLYDRSGNPYQKLHIGFVDHYQLEFGFKR